MEQITILGKSFQLHCNDSDREMLSNAGRSVDRMLQQIRRNDPSLTAEMAAFLACIQLTYDQLSNSLQDNENTVQLSSIQAKLERLNGLLDRVPTISVQPPPAPGEVPEPEHQVVKPPRFNLGAVRSSVAAEMEKGHVEVKEPSVQPTPSSTYNPPIKTSAVVDDGIPVIKPAESGDLF